MAGVTTSYQKGVHGSRPAASAGCIFYSCTTHGIMYRSDGTTWTDFLTLPGGSIAGTPALTFGTAAAAGSSGTFINSDATLPIFDATVPTTQAFSDAAAVGAAGVAARRDHKHGMPASGGLAHSYVGYNTTGGTVEDAVSFRTIAKSITLASAGLIASVGAYVQVDTGPDAVGFSVAVWTDNAAVVGNLIASGAPYGPGASGSPGAYIAIVATTPRWIHIPVGLYVAAGTYWIGIHTFGNGFGGNRLNVYYDGSGTDRRFDTAAGYTQDGGVSAQTDTTRKYSIRASVLS